MSLGFYYLIYACLQFHSSKALTTWAFFIRTLFYFSRFADACTSILFFQSLETCFIPCTSSTFDGAVPSGPLTPLTIDRWSKGFNKRRFLFGLWFLIFKVKAFIWRIHTLFTWAHSIVARFCHVRTTIAWDSSKFICLDFDPVIWPHTFAITGHRALPEFPFTPLAINWKYCRKVLFYNNFVDMLSM